MFLVVPPFPMVVAPITGGVQIYAFFSSLCQLVTKAGG